MVTLDLININHPPVQLNTPAGRVYEVENGNLYPSVSTVLSVIQNPELEKWKKSVGPEVAAKISKIATDSGTLLHNSIESYLLGEKVRFTEFEQTEKDMFKTVVPFLESLDEVICLETSLWSDTIGLAGTIDCCARIGDTYFVIDWKTSKVPKNRMDIQHYFMQAAAYSLMIYERTGRKIAANQLQIIMMVQETSELLTFCEPVKPHLESFIQLKKQYNNSDKAKDLDEQCKKLYNKPLSLL